MLYVRILFVDDSVDAAEHAFHMLSRKLAYPFHLYVCNKFEWDSYAYKSIQFDIFSYDLARDGCGAIEGYKRIKGLVGSEYFLGRPIVIYSALGDIQGCRNELGGDVLDCDASEFSSDYKYHYVRKIPGFVYCDVLQKLIETRLPAGNYPAGRLKNLVKRFGDRRTVLDYSGFEDKSVC